jgi:hypothetical protein
MDENSKCKTHNRLRTQNSTAIEGQIVNRIKEKNNGLI